MKIEFVPSSKDYTKKNRSEPPRFCIELSRTEAMKLIAGLAASLVPYAVNRYGVQWALPNVISLLIDHPIDKDLSLGEALIFVNLRDGYLGGDLLPNQKD